MTVESQSTGFTFSFVGPLDRHIGKRTQKKRMFTMLVTHDLRIGNDSIAPLEKSLDYSNHIIIRSNEKGWMDIGPFLSLSHLEGRMMDLEEMSLGRLEGRIIALEERAKENKM